MSASRLRVYLGPESESAAATATSLRPAAETTTVPLGEVLSELEGVGAGSKRVARIYEGLVTRLEGYGDCVLQTRSLSGLAGWLNPKLW